MSELPHIQRRIVIGDVHGHLAELSALLQKLDISDLRVPDGMELVFLGDLIDRGPDSAGVVSLVRSLCEEGKARCLLGNHEFNFVQFNTETSPMSGVYRRRHDEKNTNEVLETLRSYERLNGGPETLAADVDWMRTLPVALELDGLRAVHACWHPEHLDVFEERGNGWYLSEAQWAQSWIKGTREYESVEVLCKGLEESLPDGVTFYDKGGILRHRARICWWNHAPGSWHDYIRAPGIDVSALPHGVHLPESKIAPNRPTAFGHYWFTGEPRLISELSVCLDFSVAASKGGCLCAYEHRPGENELRQDRLTWVCRGAEPGAASTKM